MSDQFDIDMTLLTAYVWDECSSEDRLKVESWLTEGSDRRALVTQMRVVRQCVSVPVPDDLPTFQHHIAQRAGLVTSADGRTGQGTGSRIERGLPARGGSFFFTKTRAILTGGSAILALVLGAFLFHGTSSGHHETERVYRTAAGQRLAVHLDDGSTVMLAPATSVAIGPRQARVHGEAFFAVAPDRDRPFTVTTANTKVQVLGTKFNVRQYPAERTSMIVMDDGKVALQSLGDRRSRATPVVLTAGMLARVSDSVITVQRDIVVGDYTAWTQGRLVFNNVPLGRVVEELARAYGVDIRLADSTLTRQSMTLAVSTRENPLTPILKQLAFTVKAHVVREGSAFVIAPGRLPVRSRESKGFPPPPEMHYGR